MSKYPWAASGRAQALAAPRASRSSWSIRQPSRVLGVGIVGVNAGDLIAEGVLAIEMGATVRDVAEIDSPASDAERNAGECGRSLPGNRDRNLSPAAGRQGALTEAGGELRAVAKGRARPRFESASAESARRSLQVAHVHQSAAACAQDAVDWPNAGQVTARPK